MSKSRGRSKTRDPPAPSSSSPTTMTEEQIRRRSHRSRSSRGRESPDSSSSSSSSSNYPTNANYSELQEAEDRKIEEWCKKEEKEKTYKKYGIFKQKKIDIYKINKYYRGGNGGKGGKGGDLLRFMDSEQFFETIYSNDGKLPVPIKNTIKARNKSLIKDGLIVVLCGTHQAHFTYKERLKSSLFGKEVQKEYAEKCNKNAKELFKYPTLTEGEFYLSFNSMPGISAVDQDDTIPSLFMLNGANIEPGGGKNPEELISNHNFNMGGVNYDKQSTDSEDGKDFVFSVFHTVARQYGITTCYGPGDRVPNLSMEGDRNERSKIVNKENKLKMLTYIIHWGSDGGNGFPNVYIVNCTPNYSVKGDYTFGELRYAVNQWKSDCGKDGRRRREKSSFNQPSTTIYGGSRQSFDGSRQSFDCQPDCQTHYILSACQPIDFELNRHEETNLQQIIVDGMCNADYVGKNPKEEKERPFTREHCNVIRVTSPGCCFASKEEKDGYEVSGDFKGKEQLKYKFDVGTLWDLYKKKSLERLNLRPEYQLSLRKVWDEFNRLAFYKDQNLDGGRKSKRKKRNRTKRNQKNKRNPKKTKKRKLKKTRKI